MAGSSIVDDDISYSQPATDMSDPEKDTKSLEGSPVQNSPPARASEDNYSSDRVGNIEKTDERIDGATAPTTPAVTALDWTGPDDPDNPHNWSLSKRAYHTLTPALFGFTV